MEPCLPPEGDRELEDLVYELISESNRFTGQLSKQVILALGELVRSMNCYYSNLIEGHNTHPVDIERALAGDYSHDSSKRTLQLEATAHISVQRWIDCEELPSNLMTGEYICSIHRRFCSLLPEDLLIAKTRSSEETTKVVPGEYRSSDVIVGNHLAPKFDSIVNFMNYFEQRFDPNLQSKITRLIAIAAAHHRLLWIHPFLDGNGRVARLHSHALFRSSGVGSSLWSVARGLARQVNEYRQQLAAADDWRLGDWDGRGSLSLQGLRSFCKFFLSTCIDQVKFMGALVDPLKLQERLESYCELMISQRNLPQGSFAVLREALLAGEIARAKVPTVTGYGERQSRTIVRALLDFGVLTSESPRSPLRLTFPHKVVSSWFPALYPSMP